MWFVLLATAFGADTYINDTRVDPRAIADVRLERVAVWFDELGNVHIDAPGYNVEVVEPALTATATAARPVPTTATNTPAPPPPPPASSGVAPSRWFVVSEDSGSVGHTVEVWINGQLATTVRSGQPQAIVDIGRWLRLGPNQIEIRSSSAHAEGGTLYVYVGTGSDRSGTFVMDEPPIEFGLAADRLGQYSRTYPLSVDR
jgi:hypothetical protein